MQTAICQNDLILLKRCLIVTKKRIIRIVFIERLDRIMQKLSAHERTCTIEIRSAYIKPCINLTR